MLFLGMFYHPTAPLERLSSSYPHGARWLAASDYDTNNQIAVLLSLTEPIADRFLGTGPIVRVEAEISFWDNEDPVVPFYHRQRLWGVHRIPAFIPHTTRLVVSNYDTFWRQDSMVRDICDGSWIVLIPFGTAVGALWAPLTYCVGNTILQGIFFLGMIWRMDPFLMPRGFCIAQTLIIGFGCFLLTGVAGAISIATGIAVLRPGYGVHQTALRWRNIFVIPIVIFPIAATIVHTVVVLKTSSVKPTDDLHCDSSDPEWVRFLGYAGLPFIISLPCTFYSGKSLVRMWKTNGGIWKSNHKSTNKSVVFETVGNASTVPLQSFKQGSVNILLKEPDMDSKSVASLKRQSSLMRATPVSMVTTAQSFVTANEELPSPRSTPPPFTPSHHSPMDKSFHRPFRSYSTPLDLSVGGKGTTIVDGKEDFSDTSSAFPVFAPTKRGTTENAGKSGVMEMSDFPNGGEKDKVELDAGGALGSAVSSKRYTAPMTRLSGQDGQEEVEPRPSINLAPAIWRILLFQVAFGAVQILTCISTIVDLATHRSTPTPLGTQHFALLLAAWGPVIVFGHSPVVRKRLRFWRRTP